MLRKDGVEGYIGGVCAHDHFQADEVFSGAVARARRDARVLNLLERLGALLQNREAIRERIKDVFELQKRLCAKIHDIRQLMPYPVIDRLHNMSKTGNRSVTVEFRHVEKREDNKGKVFDVVRWRPDVIETVAAPDALDISGIEEIGKGLRKALTACGIAEASVERTEGELRAWAESLEGVDRCEAALDEAAIALGVFLGPTNLRALCWVCRKDADQIKAARAALQLTGGKDAGESGARSARDRWREEVQISRGGLEFRVP